VISVEYLAIMHKKAMEKAIVNVIKKTHHKEREENRVRKFANYFIAYEHAFQCATTRSARINFEYNWYTTIVREVG
jgi:hypothetical protein